nr:plasmid replication protein, CyRepA1 family [Calothrix sp. FACHB-1219]
MRRYAHISNGGWWCSGINILTGEDSVWGCFKPNTPAIDKNRGKPIKYEHPPKVDTEIFALRISSRIWELIARRYDVALPENYQSLPHSAFWNWVKENPQIPVIICEGAKKAAAILGCGYVAVSLPGVRSGYRQPKDEYGEACGAPYLIPQLGVFAKQGRRIYFCFDADSKRTTIRDVNHALAKTAKLLTLRGCEVKVLTWLSAIGKGIDDVIAACGRDKFDEIYCNALTLDEWNTKQLKRLTYTPDLSLNQRYLGEVFIPSSKQLIALKSPKGTGKTYFFQWITDPVIRSGEKKVLVITHRVQLGLQIVERLGLPFITEVRQTEQGSHFGVGMCIDSLHPKSQAKFNPDEWKGCWVILDEIMQLIWHLLSSSTCQKERVSIIKTFKQLLLNAVNYGGKIFIADADLNDIAIDFIKGLLGQEIESFIVENTFKFVEPWQVNLAKGKNPAQLVNILTEKIEEGRKCFVCLSGQKPKSRWGSYNLEKYYQKRYPDLRILRIDSSTVEDPKHPAFGSTANLNEIVKDYDLILSTATIETGVSIEFEHFDYVFGIFQGVQTTDSVRQHLSRYRPPVPRYIWLNGVGINKVGNGSNTVNGLLASERRKDKANIKKLTELGFEETIEGNFENIYINTWAKLGAIINDGMRKYSKQIISDLQDEGHIICEPNKLPDPVAVEATKQEIDVNRKEEYSKHRENVSAQQSITDEQFLKLDNQRCKTEEEQLQHRKAELERRYNIPCTPDVVEKDDLGWQPQIRLHYYFDEGRQFLAERDKNVMSNAIKNGDGDYFIVDTNKNLLANKIDALDYLEFDKLMQVEEISNNHQTAIDLLGKVKKLSYDLKLLGFGDFSKAKTPMEACRRLSSVIGYKFPMLRKEGKRGNQVRIYGTPAADFQKDDEGKLILVDGRAVPVSDRREEVFKAWVERDTLAREKAAAAKLEAEAQAAKLAVPESPVISHQTTAQEQAIADFDSTTDINPELVEQAIASVEDSPPQTRWTGLKLQLRQGLEIAGSIWSDFYRELSERFGQAIGLAENEPFWNAYAENFQVHVTFPMLGTRSVPCDWLNLVEAL